MPAKPILVYVPCRRRSLYDGAAKGSGGWCCAAGQPRGRTEAVERFALEPCASTARGLAPEGYEHAER